MDISMTNLWNSIQVNDFDFLEEAIAELKLNLDHL